MSSFACGLEGWWLWVNWQGFWRGHHPGREAESPSGGFYRLLEKAPPCHLGVCKPWAWGTYPLFPQSLVRERLWMLKGQCINQQPRTVVLCTPLFAALSAARGQEQMNPKDSYWLQNSRVEFKYYKWPIYSHSWQRQGSSSGALVWWWIWFLSWFIFWHMF